MQSENAVLKIDGVYKYFKLPHEKKGSIKTAFTGLYKNKDKGYEIQHALDDISFEVQKGEFFGIVGRNGSGKSTLLKIIAGIYRPTKGVVATNGKIVPFIELGVGFNPELSGRENIYLNGALLGFTRDEIDSMYDGIVEFAELERFMDQKLKNYSSGMQVRLAFSVATRAKADILIIDEVLAVGDADFQRKCFKYFRGLKKDKQTVVFVSHDMEAIREYCDRCVLIDGSKLVAVGKAEAIAEKYTQLFTDSIDSAPQEWDSKRWGNGDAKFLNVEVKVREDSIQIFATVEFIKLIENPILGVLIKNASGETVCGTNSKILKKRLNSISAGKTLGVKWNIPNIFSDDSYNVEVAITYSDGITQADWWHNASQFVIKKSNSTPHITSPEIGMNIQKNQ